MQHSDLNIERWGKLRLEEQLANIGSEIFRALTWKKKKNNEYANLANTRALELFDLSLACIKSYSQLKEVARARELWLDFFVGENQYQQTAGQWQNYFMWFNHAAQVNRGRILQG